MLNQNEKIAFCKALAFINTGSEELAEEFDCYGICDSVGAVVETADALDHFRAGPAAGGKTAHEETPFGKVYVWKGVQPEGKGQRRGDLYVMDFGTARATYFQN